ncbi:MAG: cysteine synthase A [Syntrophomonadaceae bacterium]|nr:cysteine synthase A [Syntrophomonadaceae bacterium]
MRVVDNIWELIGETPVLRLHLLRQPGEGLVCAKLEGYNPAGSIKDRPGFFMLRQAERAGKLKPGCAVLEATSGNTGIGLAMAARIMGYPMVVVMPENMSEERKLIMQAYGAELKLTPAAEGMPGAVKEAERLAAESGYFYVRQFENPDNAEAHYCGTAVEIMEQMKTGLDAVVAGIGSGGTITGIARYFKQRRPEVMMVGVEPASSAVLSGGAAGPHGIPGIGAGFVPAVLNTELIDRIVAVSDKDAADMCRELARTEALLLGISSGAAIYAARELARELGPDSVILAIAADGAEKYMSGDLFR